MEKLNVFNDEYGNSIKYRMNSDYDIPSKRELKAKLNDKRCMIDSCKLFDTCNRKKIKGNKVKCINYLKPY